MNNKEIREKIIKIIGNILNSEIDVVSDYQRDIISNEHEIITIDEGYPKLIEEIADQTLELFEQEKQKLKKNIISKLLKSKDTIPAFMVMTQKKKNKEEIIDWTLPVSEVIKLIEEL